MTRLGGDTPDAFPVHIRAYVRFISLFRASVDGALYFSEIGRAILKVVYNYDSKPVDDPFVALADESTSSSR